MRTIAIYISVILCSFVLIGGNGADAAAQERLDSIKVSNLFATHLVFPTDVIYANLSSDVVRVVILDASKDVVSIQAYGPFSQTCNLTTMESNGTLRTYIIQYEEHPRTLIYDQKTSNYTTPADTIEVSTIYTSHMVYSSEILLAYLSDPEYHFNSQIPKEGKNIFSIQAVAPFKDDTMNLTILESNGNIHTYIINQNEHPENLVMNFQEGERRSEFGQKQIVSITRKKDAPQLDEVINYPQTIHHVSTKKDGIRVTCENIFSYSDITYITVRIDNGAGVSFEADRSSFVIGTKQKRKKTIVEETPVIAKSSLGTLTVPAGETSRIAYTFDKITLAKNQFFRICVYELNGRRDFFLDLTPKDINEAKSPRQLNLN